MKTVTKQTSRHHGVVLLAIAFSAMLHLVAVFTFSISKDYEKGLRFRLSPGLAERKFDPPQAAPADAPFGGMKRLAQQNFRLPQPEPTVGSIGGDLPAISTEDRLGPPVGVQKAPWSHPESINLSQLALELAARSTEVELEEYARLYVGDADTTDQESHSHNRARMVVLRAIEAMGGLDALAALTELHVAVWMESTTHNVGTVSSRVPRYLYPVARWHFDATQGLSIEPVEVRLSLDPDSPNEPYQLYHPGPDLDAYHSQFTNYWSGPRLPNEGTRKRRDGTARRWHFLDRFLSHDVRLGYVGRQRHEDVYKRTGPSVETVLVNDHKYGQYFEAHFSQTTGLLVAITEGFTEYEKDWHLRTYGPPRLGLKATTEYADHRSVGGVLLPHRIRRRGGPTVVNLQLQILVDADSLGIGPPVVP